MLTIGAVSFALIAGALAARFGTPWTRAGAAAPVALILLTWIALTIRRWWLLRDDARALSSAVRWVEPKLALASRRACELLLDSQRRDQPALTRELSKLHLLRVLAPLSMARVRARRHRWLSLARWTSALLVLLGVALFSWQPLAVIEGLDVWFAPGRFAPVDIGWTSSPFVTYTPPQHTRMRSGLLVSGMDARLPTGTTLRFVVRPVHPDLRLVLLSGGREVAFATDERDKYSANLRVMESTEVRIAARFGDILITEPEDYAFRVTVIPDEPPSVHLDGAPGRLDLGEDTPIGLKYHVTDDYGLSAVQLVMKCSGRSKRKVLARLDSARHIYEGQHTLNPRDKFLKSCHTPVTVEVRASDNDGVLGHKWGNSPPLMLIPPPLGKRQADRYTMLVRVRDLAVEQLAKQLAAPPPINASQWGAWLERRRDEEKVWLTAAHEALSSKQALDIPSVLVSYLRQRIEKIHRGVARCEPVRGETVCATSMRRWLDDTSRAIYSWDLGSRALAHRDARRVAKLMRADVNLLVRALEAAENPSKDTVTATLIGTLDAAARQLGRLEGLGTDLSRVVQADLSRIRRALDARDGYHARLAAQDLLARLKAPTSSFLGGGGGASTESGSSGTSGSRPSTGSELPPRLDDPSSGQGTEQLARDHRELIDELDKALRDSVGDEQIRRLREEAKRHAQNIREAAKKLPPVALADDPSSADAFRARNDAFDMSSALENVEWNRALDKSESALRRLSKARRTAPSSENRDAIDNAHRVIERETKWIEQQLRRMREAANESHESSGLSRREENLARRAKRLLRDASEGRLIMPDEAREALRQAARGMDKASANLEEGDEATALNHMRDAQQMLEAASGSEHRSDEAQNEPQEASGERDGTARSPTGGPEPNIPDRDAFRGPADFRRRVQRGLKDSRDPRWRPAIQRYVEGLLQ